MPDYAWISKSDLEPSLVAKLEYIKNNHQQGKSYYIDEVANVGNPVFKNEDAYPQMVYPDAGYRLLTLYRYWNMIQYFFSSKYLLGEDWNNVLPEFIPKFIQAGDATNYQLTCLELIARIHDTHATFWGNQSVLEKYRGTFHAPVIAKMIEDQLVVTGYYVDSPKIRDELKIGDIITKINSESVQDLIKKNLYLTSASNKETQLRILPYLTLLRGQTDQMKMEISRNGKLFELSVPAYTESQLNMKASYDPNPNDSSYKILPGNIAYLYPGKYNNTQLPGIEKTFAGTKGMIIDMRCYPSDFMPFSFGAYLKTDSSPFVKFTSGDLNRPGLFYFGEPLSNGSANPHAYNQPIVIIVDATTQSSAEYTTMAFQSAHHVTVIGSTTAGADGNVSSIALPGGLYSMISGLGVYYPDGTETQRKGLKIDQVIYPTIKGMKEGRDELLVKAIALIQ